MMAVMHLKAACHPQYNNIRNIRKKLDATTNAKNSVGGEDKRGIDTVMILLL